MFENNDNLEDHDEFFSPESPVLFPNPRMGFQKTLGDYGKCSFPTALPPEYLARPTIWKRLEEAEPNSVSNPIVASNAPLTVIDMLQYRQYLRQN